MICINCQSTSIHGPERTGTRHARWKAILRCARCGSHFDAYEAWGTGGVSAIVTGLATAPAGRP